MHVEAELTASPITGRSGTTDGRSSASEAALVEGLAYHHGQVYDSYLACEADRERFWSSDRSGVVTYVKVGAHLKVGGGLLAAREDKPRLLAEFLDFVSKNHKSAVFFNITDADLSLFQRHGIQITKWGEDPLIDLAGWSCQGKAFEWLRRQRNYVTRHKVRCSEWLPGQCSPDEFHATRNEMLTVANDSLKSKPQVREMRFFEGVLDFNNLGRKRIFLARSEEGLGRIEAFVVANPYQSGTGWAFEIYRHRQDSIRGVVPHLKLHAMDLLRAEGVQQVSLGLIPGLNCQSGQAGDSSITRRALQWSSRYLNFLFDNAGLHHYKSRFRPRLENRYVCAYPRVSLMTFVTTVYLLGFLCVSPMKAAKLAWRQITKRKHSPLARIDDGGNK